MKTDKQLFVSTIVNSGIGKFGNVGWRTRFVLRELELQGCGTASLSRSLAPEDRKLGRYSYGALSAIPRLLNAYRIYLNPKFDSRSLDNRIFTKFCKMHLKRIERESRPYPRRVLHLWDFLPEIAQAYKRAGFSVVTEVVIAPVRFTRALFLSHGIQLAQYDISETERQEVATFALSDRILVPSEFVRQQLIELYGIADEKISLIPFGVDSQGDVPERDTTKTEGLDFCFVGMINSRKGIDHLLAAWSDPVFRADRLHLCGRVYPEVTDLLGRLNLPNVITPGVVNSFEYLKRCDVYVFPSLMEGSSKSIYEAMACGLPVITTFNAGSVVRAGSDGIIVPIADAEALSSAMIQLKRQPALRTQMGSSGREFVRQFTWEKYARSIVDVLKST